MPVLMAFAIEPRSLRKRVSWAWVRGGDGRVGIWLFAFEAFIGKIVSGILITLVKRAHLQLASFSTVSHSLIAISHQGRIL